MHCCVDRALRKERWRLQNIPSQKEVLLCLPVQVCCCLPPAFLPGIFFKTQAVSQPYKNNKGQVIILLHAVILFFSPLLQVPHHRWSTASEERKEKWWPHLARCRAPAGQEAGPGSSWNSWRLLTTLSTLATSTCFRGCVIFGMVNSPACS